MRLLSTIAVLAMFSLLSENAYAEKSMVNFANTIRPLVIKMKKNDSEGTDYTKVISYCTEVINDEGSDPFVHTMALYWRATAYSDMVLKKYIPGEYLDNAKLDVTECLSDEPFLPECYIPAVAIYYIEGDTDKMKRAANKALSLMDQEFVSRENSFTGQDMDIEAYKSMLKEMLINKTAQ